VSEAFHVNVRTQNDESLFGLAEPMQFMGAHYLRIRLPAAPGQAPVMEELPGRSRCKERGFHALPSRTVMVPATEIRLIYAVSEDEALAGRMKQRSHDYGDPADDDIPF
jgi:hypothetical protein